MRILIVSPHFPPWNSVAALRLHAFARAWADGGEQVEVLTTHKRDDHATEPRDCRGFAVHEVAYNVPRMLEKLRRDDKETAAGVASGGHPAAPGILRSALKRLRARTGIFSSLRMPDLTDYWVKPAVEKGLSLGRFDVIFASVGPYTSLRVAESLAASAKSSLAVDYRDLWTDNQIFSGLFPFTLRERSLENALLQRVDLVTTVSEPLAARLRARTRAEVKVVPNGFVRSDFDSLEESPFFPAEGPFRIGFTGRIYWPGHDPRPLLRALAHFNISRPGKAGLVVAGPDGELWSQLAAGCGASEYVEHIGTLTRREALRMQRDCDALVVFEWKDAHEGQMSTKVFEYLAAGPHVLVVGGPRDGTVASLVTSAGRGIATGSKESEIESELVRLLELPRRKAQLSSDPKVMRFERTEQAKSLLNDLRRLKGPTHTA